MGKTDLLAKGVRFQLLTLQQVLSSPELRRHEFILHLGGLQRRVQTAAGHLLLLTLLPAFQPQLMKVHFSTYFNNFAALGATYMHNMLPEIYADHEYCCGFACIMPMMV